MSRHGCYDHVMLEPDRAPRADVRDDPPVGDALIRRLGAHDARELHAFLAAHPADNAYLLGQLARGALDDGGAGGLFLGWWERRALTGVALLGSNAVLSHGVCPRAAAAFARFSLSSELELRVIVAPDDVIGPFVQALALPPERVHLRRDHQVLLQVDRRTLHRDARSVELRPAQIHELDHMMAIDLAMVKEELGIDPFSSDLIGYRRGWQRRILEQRAWVAGPIGGPIRCKVDQAAVSDEVVQLAGVYTAPEHRHHGLARGAVGEMCHLLLREVPCVTLYVHADNIAALRLYWSLGFYEVGRVASLWLS